MPNDRSDAALHERLEIAEKATKGLWYHVLAAIVGTKESPDDNNATCICFTEWGSSGDPQPPPPCMIPHREENAKYGFYEDI